MRSRWVRAALDSPVWRKGPLGTATGSSGAVPLRSAGGADRWSGSWRQVRTKPRAEPKPPPPAPTTQIRGLLTLLKG